MFIWGVCQLDQLQPQHLHRRLGRRRFVAATLYPEVCDSNHPHKDQLLELVLCQFAVGNRTYKRTYGNRFSEFDQEVARLSAGLPQRPLRVHDVAVSNGITAVELYGCLSQMLDQHIDYVASDVSTTIVAVRDGSLTLILDPVDNTCLQLIRPPFVFNLRKRENLRLFPINWLVRRWLEKTKCRRLLQRYLDGDPQIDVQHIDLLHPSCRRLVDSSAPFTFRRADILQPTSGPFDLVRAMNILNPGYFNSVAIRRAVSHVHASLVVGGLFAVGSNQDASSPVHGAVYRKTTDGFQRLLQSGTGSSVEEYVL